MLPTLPIFGPPDDKPKRASLNDVRDLHSSHLILGGKPSAIAFDSSLSPRYGLGPEVPTRDQRREQARWHGERLLDIIMSPRPRHPHQARLERRARSLRERVQTLQSAPGSRTRHALHQARGHHAQPIRGPRLRAGPVWPRAAAGRTDHQRAPRHLPDLPHHARRAGALDTEERWRPAGRHTGHRCDHADRTSVGVAQPQGGGAAPEPEPRETAQVRQGRCPGRRRLQRGPLLAHPSGARTGGPAGPPRRTAWPGS